MSYANARRTYMTAAVQTVTPAQLVVMLYDALLRNLDIADAAVDRGDVAGTHTALIKAQDIVTELEVSLDTTAWQGATGLQQLYRYVGAELITANVTKDGQRIRTCRELLAPLADAWRQAARAVAEATPAPADLAAAGSHAS